MKKFFALTICVMMVVFGVMAMGAEKASATEYVDSKGFAVTEKNLDSFEKYYIDLIHADEFTESKLSLVSLDIHVEGDMVVIDATAFDHELKAEISDREVLSFEEFHETYLWICLAHASYC